MIKILLLFGGNSYEHNISCKSAKNIIENIDNNILYGKLDDYKTICFSYLLDKYGKEQLDEIIKEYNLEV